jgi:hypothetical protein
LEPGKREGWGVRVLNGGVFIAERVELEGATAFNNVGRG